MSNAERMSASPAIARSLVYASSAKAKFLRLLALVNRGLLLRLASVHTRRIAAALGRPAPLFPFPFPVMLLRPAASALGRSGEFSRLTGIHTDGLTGLIISYAAPDAAI
jgi:hypothetical protein